MFLGNGAGEEHVLLTAWQVKKPWGTCPCPVSQHIYTYQGSHEHHRCSWQGCPWPLEGRIALFMLSGPPQFVRILLKKVVEQSQIGPGSDTLLSWYTPAQVMDNPQDNTAGCSQVPHESLHSPWAVTASTTAPNPCCTTGLCPSFSMFSLHQPSNPHPCFLKKVSIWSEGDEKKQTNASLESNRKSL